MSSKVHALNANDTVALASDLETLAVDIVRKSLYIDGSGKIKAEYLPSYVDDVMEFPNAAAFPASGETGKIYVDASANKTYRWGGTTYVEIPASGSEAPTMAGEYDFATMKGVITAVKDIVTAMGGTVKNFPSMA